MSKVVLDKFPKEPKECPFCETHIHFYKDEEVFMCHLREGFTFSCTYALSECVGCDKCEKITSIKKEKNDETV